MPDSVSCQKRRGDVKYNDGASVDSNRLVQAPLRKLREDNFRVCLVY